MNEKPPRQQIVKARDARDATQNVFSNTDDDIEDTFCYNLFENGLFNESLMRELLQDMQLIIALQDISLEERKAINWICLCVLRSFTSHFDCTDRYKIKNLDDEMYSRWSGEYFETLRDIVSSNLVE